MLGKGKKTLLLVEDEAILAMSEKIALEQYGYAVITANTGEKAVSAVRTIPGIDLVLMDINLGDGIDGTEAAEIILRDHDIAIVFVSSHCEREIVERTEKITSYGYVVKNSSFTVLDASIKMALKLYNEKYENRAKTNELVEKNQLLENILEYFPGCVFWKDKKSVYLGCNTAEANAAGFSTPADIVGKSDYELKWADHEPGFYIDSDKAVMNGRKPKYHIEYSYHDRNDKLVWVDASKVPLMDKEGNVSGVFGVAVDITERKKIEIALQSKNEEYQGLNEELRSTTDELQAQNEELMRSQESLRQSEARLLQAERAAKVGNWTLQLNAKTIVASAGANAIYGVDFNTSSLAEVQKIPLPEYRPVLDKALSDLVARGAPYDIEFKICRAGDGNIVDIHSVATYDKKTNTVFGVIKDITQQKKAEMEIAAQRILLSRVMETSPVGIATVDVDGSITYANYRAEEILGIEKSEITSRKYNAPLWKATDIHGEPLADEKQPFAVVRATKKTAYNIIHGITWSDGRSVLLSVNASPMFDRLGEFSGMVATFEDITEKARNERLIEKQLEEKTILLKEVHHRIKNNMNIMSSLLSLQAQAIKEPLAVSVLEDTERRIRSLTVLYDKLYQSLDFKSVSIKSYLPALIDQIIGNFPNGDSIRVEEHIEDFTMDAKRLQPLGIIINELLTNIMKYAFTGRDGGNVSISAANAEGHVVIFVHDDGNGIPDSVSFENSTGFGLQLVYALTQQLDGTIRIERGNGTKIVLEFEA